MYELQPAYGVHEIGMDGEWELLDFSGFGRQYVQVYSFMYAMNVAFPGNVFIEESVLDEVSLAFRRFPWRGGWSSVHFYNSLRNATPEIHRPRINSLRFESPGIIEIGGALAAITSLATIVYVVSRSAREIEQTYHQFHTHAQERKLLRIEVRKAEIDLKRDELDFAKDATRQLATLLEFEDVKTLEATTENSIASMKIMFSLYRRVRKLVALKHSTRKHLDCVGSIREPDPEDQ